MSHGSGSSPGEGWGSSRCQVLLIKDFFGWVLENFTDFQESKL